MKNERDGHMQEPPATATTLTPPPPSPTATNNTQVRCKANDQKGRGGGAITRSLQRSTPTPLPAGPPQELLLLLLLLLLLRRRLLPHQQRRRGVDAWMHARTHTCTPHAGMHARMRADANLGVWGTAPTACRNPPTWSTAASASCSRKAVMICLMPPSTYGVRRAKSMV